MQRTTDCSEPAGDRDSMRPEYDFSCLHAPWDRIANGPSEIPVLESHYALVKETLREHRRAPSRAQPAHHVFDRLAQY